MVVVARLGGVQEEEEEEQEEEVEQEELEEVQEQVEVLEVEEEEEEGTLGREEDPKKKDCDLKHLFRFLMFKYCLWPGRDCLRSSSYLILVWD